MAIIDRQGNYLRPESRFRAKVEADPCAVHPAESGRYRLYVSRACPWAHRTLIVRALKGLEVCIPVTISGWKLENFGNTNGDYSAYRGWNFDPTISDEPHGFQFLDQLYEHADPGYRAGWGDLCPKFTVPVLFDEKLQKIVSNESSEIVDMLNSQFNEFARNPELDLLPEGSQGEIEEVNSWVYPGINNGVYRCGFAMEQAAYDAAAFQHYSALDRAEAVLAQRLWLCGSRITMADVRLFPTLIRYDVVYTGHFKTARLIADMPALTAFVQRFVSLPGIAETCSLHDIARHYYWSHRFINPTGIVPRGLRAVSGMAEFISNDWGIEFPVAGRPREENVGGFQRRPSRFNKFVADGDSEFPAEAGRYRLYVATACPWAHRALIVRALKGLEKAIPVTKLSWRLPNLPTSTSPESFAAYRGWEFDDEIDPNPHGFKFLDELYEHADPGYRASFEASRPVFSVPVLFDERTQKIVNNESSSIVTMLNNAFNSFCENPSLDLYPEALRSEIDEVNDFMYSGVNNGVYRCGFAPTQETYDVALEEHWAAMQRVERMLEDKVFLVGDTLTLCDIRLFPTLVRYDLVYVHHFKTALKRLVDMPNLLRHTRHLLQIPAVSATVCLHDIVRHYYSAQLSVNGTGIVPRGMRRAPGLGDLVENTFGMDSDLTPTSG